MVRRRTVAAAIVAAALPIGLIAQSEDFKGQFEIDRGKVRNVKRIALADVVGQTKLDRQKVGEWTEEALKALADGFRGAGFDVVMGPEVKAAFLEVAPLPTADEIKVQLRKGAGRNMTEAQMDGAIKMVLDGWEKHEPGDYQQYGLSMYRPAGSVNLDRPMFDAKDPRKSKNPDEKEVRRRIAALREKLGVDAVVKVDFGFGSWRYEEPAWQKQAKDRGAVIGIVPAIQNIRGLFKGAQAQAFFNIEMFDREGKKRIIEIQGGCKSKDGTGFSLKPGAVEKFVVPAVEDCSKKIFEKYAKD
jgi:hypothetical protein